MSVVFLHYILAGCIGALSALLVNKNLAVYNDGFRPVYAEYFAGKMDRKSLAATSFAISFGLVVGFGFTNSIAMGGLIIIHTFLLMSDIIGTWFKDNKVGALLSAICGGAWAILLLFGMQSIQKFFASLPVNFLDNLGSVAGIVVATFSVFPTIAVIFQFGLKRGVITGLLTALTYILLVKFGVFTYQVMDPVKNQMVTRSFAINAIGMSMLVGTLLLIFFAAKEKRQATGANLTSLFTENVKRIRKNWMLFAVMGGLISAGAATVLLTSDVISGGLVRQGLFTDAALVALVRAIGYIPLVYTTAIVTGVFSPAGSYFAVPVGFFLATFAGLSGNPLLLALVAFACGAITVTLETMLLGAIGTALDKFPALREMGDHIRNAMSQVLELALLVGGFIASANIMGQLSPAYAAFGSMAVMGTWLINRNIKKPFLMPLAVGPVVAIALGIFVNILKLLKF